MRAPAALAYEVPGPLTAVDEALGPYLAELPADPVDICRVVQSLVVLPDLASTAGIPEERHGERNIRPVSGLLGLLQALDPTPVQERRPPAHRVVGTCRHFAVLACAFLRHQGVPARARCGFATYFVPEKYVDHWIVEHWQPSDSRWVRVDAEILGLGVVARPDDLADGEFLTGGEAWTLCRAGGRPGELRCRRSCARLGHRRSSRERHPGPGGHEQDGDAPVGRMGPHGGLVQGRDRPDFDDLMDAVAEVCASDDRERIRDLYRQEDLEVPADMIR